MSKEQTALVAKRREQATKAGVTLVTGVKADALLVDMPDREFEAFLAEAALFGAIREI